MNILIIENETYLAQSIALKLGDAGFGCEVASDVQSMCERTKHYDVVLLSTNVPNFMKLVHTHKSSVILLMVNYVSSDTVSVPIEAGAFDYIQKPFMIEELVRKIRYFHDFNRLRAQNQAYASFIRSQIEHKSQTPKRLLFPMLIKSNRQQMVDSFVFNYVFAHNISLRFTDLSGSFNLNELYVGENDIRYLTNFQVLKGNKLEQICRIARGQNFIFHTNSHLDIEGFNCIEINSDENLLALGEILTIEDYIKNVISVYQKNHSDTDLARKLGISRKSLWEKRKKYNMPRR